MKTTFFNNPPPDPSTEEKMVKLMENENALLVCSHKFCEKTDNAFLTDITPANATKKLEEKTERTLERSFVDKINAATLTRVENNPFQSLWHAIQSERLKGRNHNLCSARVNDAYRVIFIAKHSVKLDKIVVCVIAVYPNHEYDMEKIAAKYQSKGRICGSKNDWMALFAVIHSGSFIIPAVTQPLPKPKKLLSLTPPLKHSKAIPNTIKEVQENRSGSSTSTVPADSEKPSIHTPSFSSSENSLEKEPIAASIQALVLSPSPEVPSQNAAESSEVAPIKKKNKKKKKKKPEQKVAELQEDTDEDEMLENILQADATTFAFKLGNLFDLSNKDIILKIVTKLLDLGMNPEMTGLQGQSLLRFAIMDQQLEVVQLLLDSGAGLLTYDPLSTKELLMLAVVNGDNIDIIKALVAKTKELGKLNNMLIGYPNQTILHIATMVGNVEAVKVLLAAGADITIKNESHFDPLGCALSLLGDVKSQKTMMSLLQARGLKPRTTLEIPENRMSDKKTAKLWEPRELTLHDARRLSLTEKQAYTEIKRLLIEAKKLSKQPELVANPSLGLGR